MYGTIDDPIATTLTWVNVTCFILKIMRVLVVLKDVWKRKATVVGSPFMVMLLNELGLALIHRMYFFKHLTANQPPIVPYVTINVIIWLVYFFGRTVAVCGFPAWRVTTALFCIQFLTDIVSVSLVLPCQTRHLALTLLCGRRRIPCSPFFW